MVGRSDPVTSSTFITLVCVTVLDRLLDGAARLDRWVAERSPPPHVTVWLWPLAQVLTGLGATLTALLVSPAPHETLTLFGEPYGEPCGFLTVTGLPCPSCGMTRSWVWWVRGEALRAIAYSPAGAALLAWLQLSALQGALRLALRRPQSLRLDHRLLAAWVIFWMLGLNLAHWFARLKGFNPLP